VRSLVLGQFELGYGAVTDLAQRLGMAKQAVSSLADRLVTLGYCDRLRDDANRRQVLLRPTDDGRDAAAVLRTAVADIDRRMLGHLSDRDRESFRRALVILARPGARKLGRIAKEFAEQRCIK
jgi:DNA-binding MarR family transcriptional regulator